MLLHAFGSIGLILIMGAYWLNSTGRLTTGDPRFQIMNFVGAAVSVVYLVLLAAWASVVLNVIWAVIAAWVLIRGKR